MTDENKPTPDEQSAVETEQTETPENEAGSDNKQDDEKTQPKKKGGRLKRTFWYLILVIIIATIAWLVVEKPYQQFDFDLSSVTEVTETTQPTQQKTKAVAEPAVKPVDQQEPTYDPRSDIAALTDQLQDVTRQVTALQQDEAESSGNQQQLTRLKKQLSELSQRLQAQRNQLAELSRQLPEQQVEQAAKWRLFEAKQTVSAAGRLLWGAQNHKAALKLLQVADQQLAGIESAAAIQIRQLLASDIARLEASIDSQSDELVLAITGLQQRLNDLPNRVEKKRFTEQQGKPTKVSAAANDWKANLAANWDDFVDTFIRIQPTTGQAEPLLTTTERKAMALRMNLLLTMAQHAAITDNGKLWRRHIDQLIPLVAELKGQTDAVNDVISRLKSLRSSTIQRRPVEQLTALDALAKAVAMGGL
ncbi:MAG: uroporphyrinogen-III C-methyltransferase [Pseudomonadota bacterium]